MKMFRQKAEKLSKRTDIEKHFQVLQQSYLSYKLELDNFEEYLKKKAQSQTPDGNPQHARIHKTLLTNIDTAGPNFLGKKQSEPKAQTESPRNTPERDSTGHRLGRLGKRSEMAEEQKFECVSVSHATSTARPSQLGTNRANSIVSVNSGATTTIQNKHARDFWNKGEDNPKDVVSVSENQTIEVRELIECESSSHINFYKTKPVSADYVSSDSEED